MSSSHLKLPKLVTGKHGDPGTCDLNQGTLFFFSPRLLGDGTQCGTDILLNLSSCYALFSSGYLPFTGQRSSHELLEAFQVKIA